jgi:hypothetical protein
MCQRPLRTHNILNILDIYPYPFSSVRDRLIPSVGLSVGLGGSTGFNFSSENAMPWSWEI